MRITGLSANPRGGITYRFEDGRERVVTSPHKLPNDPDPFRDIDPESVMFTVVALSGALLDAHDRIDTLERAMTRKHGSWRQP